MDADNFIADLTDNQNKQPVKSNAGFAGNSFGGGLNFKRTVVDNLTSMTFHTLDQVIVTSDYFLKPYLFICFLASTGFCFYFTVKTFIDYSSYEVLTSTSIVSDIPAEFPVVGICNLNQYDFNFANADVLKFADDGTINQNNPNYTANDYSLLVNQYFRSNLIKEYLNDLYALYNDDIFLDQMLLSCTYQQLNCSIDDFMFQYDFSYGLCWRFNSGRNLHGNTTEIRTSGQVGWKNGLQLEMYTGNIELQEKFSMIRGFRVFVFNRSNVYPIPGEIGVDVSTGQATNIGIRRIFANHLPSPYSDCLPSDIAQIDWTRNYILQFMYDNFVTGQFYWSADAWFYAGNWTWDWTVSYTQSICVKMCFQKYLFETCGCYDLTLPRSPQVTELYLQYACVNESQLTCEQSLQAMFYNNASLIGDCYLNCPVECTEVTYDLTISSSYYPTQWYANILANNTKFNSIINAYFPLNNLTFINYTNDYDTLRSIVARINVYYEDLRYTEIDDNPAMNFVTLLGTLGGNLGLFLGASLLSFNDLFKLVYELAKQLIELLFMWFRLKSAQIKAAKAKVTNANINANTNTNTNTSTENTKDVA